jgi:hypothetical protein
MQELAFQPLPRQKMFNELLASQLKSFKNNDWIRGQAKQNGINNIIMFRAYIIDRFKNFTDEELTKAYLRI